MDFMSYELELLFLMLIVCSRCLLHHRLWLVRGITCKLGFGSTLLSCGQVLVYLFHHLRLYVTVSDDAIWRNMPHSSIQSWHYFADSP